MDKKPYCLVGVNGNAHALMGYTHMAMKECGRSEEYTANIMTTAKSGNYDHLVYVLAEELQKLNEENGLSEE